MHSGYIKLWRKTLESEVWNNHNVFRLWCWCLMKATYKKINQIVGYQSVTLEPGQFIFGRKKCSMETGLSEQTVRTCLQTLKSTNNLTIKVTSKFSIISIINWNAYQSDEKEINQQSNQQTNQQLTNNQPATNHKQEVKEVKNIKNKRDSGIFVPPTGEQLKQNGYDWIDSQAWDDFVQHRYEIKEPLSDLSVKKTISLLSQYKQQQREIIDKTIISRWTGVFKPKGNHASTDTGPRYRTLEAPND